MRDLKFEGTHVLLLLLLTVKMGAERRGGGDMGRRPSKLRELRNSFSPEDAA